MSSIEQAERDLPFYENQIKNIHQLYDQAYHRAAVKMVKGKYKGRLAIIDGVIIERGRLAFGCMVLRKDGKGVLNSDGDSRSYLPREWFELTP